ncbi:alpha/beta hydrolase [Bifidobacterium sp.]|jgi:acetyl esterase/lipase|uniref:alpha/beta hydrolase n=1 Tax=Bifidobacterium sp. TaxID=41200 RepID=UPI0025BD2131|nr:alpha/beta hydrolase [Bifidobacterium sp.]MCH4208590.1 alpha/beta hydrolase [Bifidobacterium sp.]MCI1224276.1 alpha/beta hydrolase [Bifidobacterium sp.]
MNKRIRRFVVWTLGVIVAPCLIVVIAFSVSPVPGALVIRQMFSGKVAITDPKAYHAAAGKVQSVVDRTYRSSLNDNTYDTYYPKSDTNPVPVLIWLHGGGYVGGDKESVREFATRIVADAGIAVVAMNYERAPGSHFPNQVRQVDELVQDLQHANDSRLDMSALFFGGDSAGAQIALQYATVQTNPAYAKDTGFKQSVEAPAIKGVISYCGPVDLRQMADAKTTSRFMAFFIKTVAWSLLGSRDWRGSRQLQRISLVDNVTKDFPPTYITDGNAYSFPEQGIALERRLQALSVPVTGLLFEHTSKQVSHEYQFNDSTPEARRCYEQTLAFVNAHSGLPAERR